MHPDISRLPSRVFYNEKLLDGPDMDVQTKQPWHSHEKFGPYRFFNVSRGREETRNSHSLINRAECEVAVSLFTRIRLEYSSFDFDFRVGVISMYRAQIAELRRTFIKRFGQDIVGRVDFNTVDGFQGQEKDVIILSCVRAGPGLQSVGFLAGEITVPSSTVFPADAQFRYSANERCPDSSEIVAVYTWTHTHP
jgi:senataxin